MKIPISTFGQLVLAGIILITTGVSLAVDPSPAVEHFPKPDRCEDLVNGIATVVPGLDSPLFHTTKTSYHWWIVDHDDGHLENTAGGEITADDLLRIEHTADCTSSHQGEHLMEFCDAVATTDGVKLTLSGGMPAYASDLTITLNAKLEFTCSFSAESPSPTGALRWKVTKKSLKLKSADLTSRARLRGWISVEFEEFDAVSKVTHTYKIEGYFKPVIQTFAEGKPSKDGDP